MPVQSDNSQVTRYLCSNQEITALKKVPSKQDKFIETFSMIKGLTRNPRHCYKNTAKEFESSSTIVICKDLSRFKKD